MAPSRRAPLDFVSDVNAATREYLTDLKVENEALRQLISLHRAEKARLDVEVVRQQQAGLELTRRLSGKSGPTAARISLTTSAAKRERAAIVGPP